MAGLKESINGRLCSKRFNVLNIPEIQCYFEIYPNGDDEDSRGQVWIFLYVESGDELKVKIDGKFCVESAGYISEENYDYDEFNGWGFQICETAELFDPSKKFIVDGEFVFKCEGTLSVEKEKPVTGNLITFGAGYVANMLFWMNEDKNFIIRVGHKCIKVSLTFKKQVYIYINLLKIYNIYNNLHRSTKLFSLFTLLSSKLCSIPALKKQWKTK